MQIVPLTSQTAKVYPSEALVRVGGRTSKAAADQITTAARERFRSRLGSVSSEEMTAIEQAIRIQLDL